MKRTRCRLCDSTDIGIAIRVPPMPIVDAYTQSPNLFATHPCDIYFCYSCGHIQLLDILPPDSMFTEYLFRTADNPELIEHYQQYSLWLHGRCDLSSVIEIGCNDGTLLALMPKKKLGIDPSNVPCSSEKITAFLTETIAKQTVKDFGRATTVVANHVFAHADDLQNMLHCIRLMLTSRGKFVFEVAYAQDMVDKCLLEQIEHEHLSYHTISPLIKFLQRNGMELSHVERNLCKGGSIRCIAEPMDSGHIPVFEEKCGIDELTVMERNIAKMREKLSDIPAAIGYGASAPCTSVIYQLGLQRKLRFLVDDNPRRHWLYAPESNLCVLPSSAIHDFDIPIIILASRYSNKMRSRHITAQHRFIDIMDTDHASH